MKMKFLFLGFAALLFYAASAGNAVARTWACELDIGKYFVSGCGAQTQTNPRRLALLGCLKIAREEKLSEAPCWKHDICKASDCKPDDLAAYATLREKISCKTDGDCGGKIGDCIQGKCRAEVRTIPINKPIGIPGTPGDGDDGSGTCVHNSECDDESVCLRGYCVRKNSNSDNQCSSDDDCGGPHDRGRCHPFGYCE